MKQTAVITGKGYLAGQPTTHIACTKCGDKKRIGLDVQYSDIDRTVFGAVKKVKKKKPKVKTPKDDPDEEITWRFVDG